MDQFILFFLSSVWNMSGTRTYIRQNHLVCSDIFTILTDQGHIAELLQVLHFFFLNILYKLF